MNAFLTSKNILTPAIGQATKYQLLGFWNRLVKKKIKKGKRIKMKDKNGIEIECENCDDFIPVGTNGRGCTLYEEDCEDVFGGKRCIFKASSEAYEARIAELQELVSTLKQKLTKKEQERRHESSLLNKRIAAFQKELNIVQESERAEAQEADRLRAEAKELKAHNEVLQKRVEEFSMELLDYNMKENRDVLERLKQAESEENS